MYCETANVAFLLKKIAAPCCNKIEANEKYKQVCLDRIILDNSEYKINNN